MTRWCRRCSRPWYLLVAFYVLHQTLAKKQSSLLETSDVEFVAADCVDEYDQCEAWAKAGYCEALVDQVKPICRKSCPNACADGSFYWEEQDFTIDEDVNPDQIRVAVANTLDYLHNEIYADNFYEPVRDRCINLDSQCSYWAAMGECNGDDEEWMTLNCAPACRTCLDLDKSLRCPWDPHQPLALEGTGLNEMFVKIITDPSWKSNVTILSRPAEFQEENDTIPEGPWVVLLDDFVTEAECQALIDLGGTVGYFRSESQAEEMVTEEGDFKSEVSDYRTSYQTWCQDECYEDPIPQRVTDRMAQVTGINEMHFDYLQLLKYDTGQYYRVHHDYVDLMAERPQGPRLLTVYLYLNDVPEGGGTRFPLLKDNEGLTVMPKRGRAVIWPSVTNEDLMEFDYRTEHEALPVEKGYKYGANAWIHLGNLKKASADGCV